MRPSRLVRLLAVVLGLPAVFAVAAILFREPLARFALGAAGKAAGYDVSAGPLSIGTGETVLEALRVRSGNDPVLDVPRVDLRYSLGDWLANRRLFGLTAVAVERPHLTVVRHADGSYNVHLPAAGSGGGGGAPLDLTFHIANGSATLTDRSRLEPASRPFGVAAFQLDGRIGPGAPSSYRGSFDVVEGGRRYPVRGGGRFDDARGYESQHWTAAAVPLGPPLDFAVNRSVLDVAGGTLRGLDLRAYALRDHGGTLQRHLGGTATVAGLTLYLGALAKPLRDGGGRVYLYDDGVTAPHLSGSIAQVPVTIAGGLYGLGQPYLRLGISGRGDLARLGTLARSATPQQLAGATAFRVLVEGDVRAPLTLVGFDAPQVRYKTFAFERATGLVALSGIETDVLRAALAYDGVALGARGRGIFRQQPQFDVALRASGPAGALPYLSDIAPDLALRATAVAAGTGEAIGAAGSFDGTGPGSSLAGTFALDPSGRGTVGPLLLTTAGGGSVFGSGAFDRRRGLTAGVATLRGLHVAGPLAGVADGTFAAGSDGKRLSVAGAAHLADVALHGAPLGSLDARGNVDVPLQHPDAANVAVAGRYRGSLASLSRLAGRDLGTAGDADVQLAVVGSQRDAIVQIDGGRSSGTVRGFPLRDVAATIGLRGSDVDVYAARANLGTSTIVASGALGPGRTLSLSAGDVDLSGSGTPLTHGNLTALATVGGTLQAPRVDAGVVLTRGVLGNRYPLDANAGLSYADDRLRISNGSAGVGPLVAQVDGAAHGLRSGRPSYAVDARVRSADVTLLAVLAGAHLPYPAGTFEADVRVSGSGTDPRVDGRVAIPEGSINGLSFEHASMRLGGRAGDVIARDGHVTLGDTTLAFSGAYAPSLERATVSAPHLHLSDFNDYFDEGGLLGGNGSADVAVSLDRRLQTRGTVALDGARFRQFKFGNVNATWSTRQRTIDANAVANGGLGRLEVRGSAILPSADPLRDPLHRVALATDFSAEHVDLGNVLPLAGIRAPLFGYVDARARLDGSYPGLTAQAEASWQNGEIARVPVTRAGLTLTATRGRVTVTSAVFDVPELSVTAGGSLGLGPGAPLALTVEAKTPDVGALAHVVTGKTYDLNAALTTTARFAGTFAAPTLHDTTDISAIRYAGLTVPHARADITIVNRRRLQIDSAEVDFTKGRLTAAGTVPLRRSSPWIGPPRAPLALRFAAEHVDLAQFSGALPKNTKLTGDFSGDLSLAGTVRAPQLDGAVTLAGGSFVSDAERAKMTGLRARLEFAGQSATLREAHADVGGGALDAHGTASLGDLSAPGDNLTYALALTASNAYLDLPQYLHGHVDANLTFARAAGATPLLGGTLTFSQTRIPVATLVPPAPAASAKPALPDVAFNLEVTAGRDVRVQNGNVDILGTGSVAVSGTLEKPVLNGTFISTNGSISFYRSFRLQSAAVTFDPALGLTPLVDATATTSVSNPYTNITLDVTGPANNLNVALTSSPSYSRDQILGLLVNAQALGAISGLGPGTPGQPQPNLLAGIAEDQLSTLFTRNLIEPVSSQVGSAIGLSDLGINYSAGGGVDLSARKNIFKNLDFVFSQTFNYPERQSVGIVANPGGTNALQLTYYTQPGFNPQTGIPQTIYSQNQTLTSVQPSGGTSGFAFSFQRKF